MVQFVSVASATSLVLANLVTLAGWFGPYWWALELPSHFTPQLTVVQILGLVFVSPMRRWLLTVVTLPFLAVNVLDLVPYYDPTTKDGAGRQPRASGDGCQRQ